MAPSTRKRSLHALALLISITTTSAFVASTGPQPRRLPTEVVLFADAPAATGQAAYGITEELPDSYVRCGQCHTVFAMTEDELGARGRRLECSVCEHSWFQSKDRIMRLRDDFELVPLPDRDMARIKTNMDEGKAPNFMGEKKLYVGNIAFQCHEEDLYDVFSKCGEVGEVSLVADADGRMRGFGFVTMRTQEGGDKAVEELDGLAVRGRNIAVRESNN